jgi:hypothetical protein
VTTAAAKTVEIPNLALSKSTEAEYGRFAARTKRNEFWWYFNGVAPFRGYSRPFADRDGRWWYRVKPGFAWPVDFFAPFAPAYRSPGKFGLLGWQFPIEESLADSRVWMNVIHDLPNFGIEKVAENKRRAVRRGLRQLHVRIADPRDPALCREACEVWNSHVVRTAWNRPFEAGRFQESWAELADWPGTSVLTARLKDGDEKLCAWLIARVIDGTVFVDTLASHTDRLADRPNDAIVFSALASAQATGVAHAHYSLKSDVTSLEEFKTSLGFAAHPFPSRLCLSRPVRLGLQWGAPKLYQRLRG